MLASRGAASLNCLTNRQWAGSRSALIKGPLSFTFKSWPKRSARWPKERLARAGSAEGRPLAMAYNGCNQFQEQPNGIYCQWQSEGPSIGLPSGMGAERWRTY